MIKTLKFGGSTFLELDHYRHVAAHIAGRLGSEADKMAVVVSAMSGTTGNLKTAALKVNKQIPLCALDTALATGEILSACFMEAALSELGVKTASLFGYSLGIRTNSDFTRATVTEVEPSRLRAAIDSNDVVVVAGGQAIDERGRLTMLGRNSSDLSAVIVAAELGCEDCEIYSDVEGIYTADPYLVPGARLIPTISHSAVSRMSRRGAKVLHHRAVDYAQQHDVTIKCKSFRPEERLGTVIAGHAGAFAVIVHPEAMILQFADAALRDAARTSLETKDLSSFAIEVAGGPSLCLSHDVDFALAVLSDQGIAPLEATSKALVTEFTPSGCSWHVNPDLDSAVAFARALHELRFPDDDGGVPTRAMREKQRSAHSNLLLGDDGIDEEMSGTIAVEDVFVGRRSGLPVR